MAIFNFRKVDQHRGLTDAQYKAHMIKKLERVNRNVKVEKISLAEGDNSLIFLV